MKRDAVYLGSSAWEKAHFYCIWLRWAKALARDDVA